MLRYILPGKENVQHFLGEKKPLGSEDFFVYVLVNLVFFQEFESLRCEAYVFFVNGLQVGKHKLHIRNFRLIRHLRHLFIACGLCTTKPATTRSLSIRALKGLPRSASARAWRSEEH